MVVTSRRMADRGPARRQRRTQQQRSAETRALLLDVTIECLAEVGYARTTAQVIADRAGVSRGAQLHHFGTKPQLVTAAMEHLFERRDREFRDAFARMPPGVDPIDYGIDLLWRILSGPTGYAYLELVAAARTDPDLNSGMVELTRRMDEGVDNTFRELFDAAPGGEGMFDLVWTALFSLLEGLAIEKIVREDDARVERVVGAVKQLARLAIVPRAVRELPARRG